MKYCVKCKEKIHPKRLSILPNTTTCTECSKTEKIKGIVVTVGEGDHTYNDLVLVHDDELEQILSNDIKNIEDMFEDSAEIIDFETEKQLLPVFEGTDDELIEYQIDEEIVEDDEIIEVITDEDGSEI